jgi:hypothetical protein
MVDVVAGELGKSLGILAWSVHSVCAATTTSHLRLRSTACLMRVELWKTKCGIT